jgi:hypothetical protein
MGTYSKGILGPFSGKIGPVVGAQWRNKEVIRSVPKKTGRIPSEAQKLQRLKFTVVIQFLALLKIILDVFYSEERGDESRFNLATSYHLKYAVVFDGTNFVMKYSNVLISKGELVGLLNPQVTPSGGAALKITWTDNSGQGNAKDTDRVIIAVYDPGSKSVFYNLDLGKRIGGSAGFQLPNYLVGAEVQTWVSVVTADQSMAATSFYGGAIVLT